MNYFTIKKILGGTRAIRNNGNQNVRKHSRRRSAIQTTQGVLKDCIVVQVAQTLCSYCTGNKKRFISEGQMC